MADLAKLIKLFEASEEASVESRAEGERARDYYDDKQITDAEAAILTRRKQPPVVDNMVKPKIDSLCGLERQTRTDPACFPRTYGDDESAQVATDALRYVADDQKLDIKRSAVFNNMLTEGFGGVEVIAKKVKNGIDPHIIQIAWDRLFADPHSSQADYSDAAYCGFITWMDTEEAKAQWPGKDDIVETSYNKASSERTETFADKPKWALWADKTRNRVRIVTMYYKEKAVWHRVVFTLAGELEECAPSPWLDEDKQPECGLILASAYVDRDNNRYGLVRGMFSLQDEVNKRRSKYLHLVNSRQMRFSRGFEADKAELRKEGARPDGIFIADKDEMEIVGTSDMSVGHLNLLQEAKQSLQGIGPNAHMQGKEGKDQSGRAILAMQQAGMTEMAPLLDSLRDFNLRVFRAAWNRIRQFWNEERWIRVTDDEKAVKFFAVNTTQAQVAMQKVKDGVEKGKLQPEQAQQFAQQIQMDPNMQAPANVLAELDVDIQIDEVMNTPTLHAEQFEMLSQAIGTGVLGQPPPPAIIEMWLRASTFRDKQKMIDVLKEAQEGQGQMGQQQQELQTRAANAEIAGKETAAMLNAQKAEGQAIDNQLKVPQALVAAQSQGFKQEAA